MSPHNCRVFLTHGPVMKIIKSALSKVTPVQLNWWGFIVGLLRLGALGALAAVVFANSLSHAQTYPVKPIRKAVIEPGMVFAFEPNACWESHRVNIGGTVVVTADGCEELNRIPCHVTHV